MVFLSCSIISFAFFMLQAKVATEDAEAAICSGQCERTATDGDSVLNHALLGHTISTMPTTNPYICHYNCFMECRCLSYQMSNAGCEMLDEDRFSKPASFQVKNGYRYHDMMREYYQSKSLHDSQTCLNNTCQNGCCKSQPCLNNGQCVELCKYPRLKFNCTCPEGYIGKLCQNKARSCKDYLGNGTSGKYVVIDQAGNKLTVFCDFLSEKGFAWTLVESFSFRNNFQVKSYPFFEDRPLNETNPNWELYRLSYTHIKDIAGESTYFRATCQFPVEGVNYVDYVRGKLTVTNVLRWVSWNCHKHNYINIRGHQCHECTAISHQTNTQLLHLEAFYSHKCTLNRVPVARKGEESFGSYKVKHSDLRCTADQDSTTQWWLGGP